MENLKFHLLTWFFIFFIILTGNAYSQSNVNIHKYPYLSLKHNIIQFHDVSSMKKFYSAWKKTGQKKMHVIHLGDSHVQNDIYPGRVRKNLQALLGDGGRGMMFSYSAAKTYSSVDYKTEHEGEWQFAKSFQPSAKLPMGLAGMSVKTLEPQSSLKFILNEPVPEHYRNLRIFFDRNERSFPFHIIADNSKIKVITQKITGPYIPVKLPVLTDTIKFEFHKSSERQSEFIFFGMSLESKHNKGILWHNCGVGGAAFPSIFVNKHLPVQLYSIMPDMVILDFGTNDYLIADSIDPKLESDIKRIIKLIRQVSPDVTILLTTTQEMRYKDNKLSSTLPFRQLILKVARTTNVAYWDWHSISGGEGVAERWREDELMKKDFIHLTKEGYELKGELLSSALMQAVQLIDKKKVKSNILSE